MTKERDTLQYFEMVYQSRKAHATQLEDNESWEWAKGYHAGIVDGMRYAYTLLFECTDEQFFHDMRELHKERRY